MKFKEKVEPKYSDDFWYDLIDGGYIDPSELLEKSDADKVKDAIKTLQEFYQLATDEGYVELV